MATATEPVTEPASPSTDEGDQLIHAVCPRCHPLAASGGACTSLCGYSDTEGHRVDYDPTRACIVCVELRPAGCPTCGLR